MPAQLLIEGPGLGHAMGLGIRPSLDFFLPNHPAREGDRVHSRLGVTSVPLFEGFVFGVLSITPAAKPESNLQPDSEVAWAVLTCGPISGGWAQPLPAH